MPLPSSEGRSNHYRTCMHTLSMSWLNHNSALDYVTWAMDSNNEVPTKAASPTSDYQMGNPNSTNIAGFHQSDTLFPRMPLPSSEGRSNHYKTCMHALSMSWQNHNSALDYATWAMDSNNEVPTKVASPTSDDQMANPNSTNIAGFHQSDTHATAFIRRQIKPL